MTLHTSTYKWKRVFVVLKNGDKFVDRFMDKKSGYVFFQEQGKIAKSQIKTMTIHRHQPPRNGDSNKANPKK